jgi:hypothetical protein
VRIPQEIGAGVAVPIIVQLAIGRKTSLHKDSLHSNPSLAGMACEMIPVIGTILAVGPVELAPYDTTYRYVVIEKEDGSVWTFATVHAIPEVSGLVQGDAAGTFLFLDGADGCRLSFFYRDDGARAVDFEALHVYFDQVA